MHKGEFGVSVPIPTFPSECTASYAQELALRARANSMLINTFSMSILFLVVNDVKCHKYTTKKHFHKRFMRLFLKTCRLQHIWQCRHSEQENVSRFTTRFFPPIVYRPHEGFPATLHAHSMRLCLPPDDCMLTHFHIFQGNGSPECARGGRSVNKSRAIALRVSTNSVWLLQHCQRIQFIMRESIRGKQGKRSKKLPGKSIQ